MRLWGDFFFSISALICLRTSNWSISFVQKIYSSSCHKEKNVPYQKIATRLTTFEYNCVVWFFFSSIQLKLELLEKSKVKQEWHPFIIPLTHCHKNDDLWTFSYLDAFLKEKRVDALYTFCPNLRRPHSVEISEFYSQNIKTILFELKWKFAHV